MSGTLRQILLMLIVLNLLSCNNKKDAGRIKTLNQEQVTEKLMEANRIAIETENEQIEKLIDSTGWKMEKTATGLRYEIIEKGNGPVAKEGKTVRYGYEVRLISGEVIYTSDQSGFKEFKIGSGGVESGLEEGILMLSVGDKARFIIPSYLAHGLSGDQDKVPPKATLIYIVKLIEVK